MTARLADVTPSAGGSGYYDVYMDVGYYVVIYW